MSSALANASAKFDAELEARLVKCSRRAVALVSTLLAVFVLFSLEMPLSSSVVTQGFVVAAGLNKKIQHPYGGVVGTIAVKDGTHVRAGDLLFALDPVQTQASRDLLRSQQLEYSMRSARLIAERDHADRLEVPAEFANDPAAEPVFASEHKLFERRRTALRNQEQQLHEKHRQTEIEIETQAQQAKSKKAEIELLERELARVQPLYKQRLVPETRLLSTQRELTRLANERDVLAAQLPKLNAALAEIKLQMLLVRQTAAAEASRDLRDVEAKLAEIRERLTIANDQLGRIDIRAPIDGVVHELTVRAIGQVIAQGETLMYLVPEHGDRNVEVRISPSEIDQVRLGQTARLKLSAFNQRTTPELEGVVNMIAPDISKEQATGAIYYTARIAIGRDTAKTVWIDKLSPGMPIEAHILANSRTAWSYLMKPLTDNFERAFREK